MNVDMPPVKEQIMRIELGDEDLREGISDLDGLLHDLAEVSGDDDGALVFAVRGRVQGLAQGCLDEQHRAAHGRPGQACDNPRRGHFVEAVRREHRLAHKFLQRRLGHVHVCQLLLDQLEGYLTEDLLDLLLQVAYSAFTAVVLDESVERAFVKANFVRGHSGLFNQLRYQVLLEIYRKRI
jgi:hypothetical protein